MNKIIIFSGVDKTGKDTLIREVHKKTHYKYPIINRFTESTYAYGKFRGRNIDYNKIFEIEESLRESFDVYLIYLYTDKDKLVKRFKKTNEKDIKIADIDKVIKCYEEYLKKTNLKYIKVNTADSISNNVNEIVNFIETESESIVEKIEKLVRRIKRRRLSIMNTTEIVNVRMRFQYDRKNIDGVMEELYEYHLKNNKLTSSQIEEFESYYYKRIKNSLIHNIKKILLEQKQSLLSRQMIYTSNECISSIHLLKRNDKLIVNVYFRSSNVLNILPLDIFSLVTIIEDVCSIFNIDVKTIMFDIFIGSAHIYRKEVK